MTTSDSKLPANQIFMQDSSENLSNLIQKSLLIDLILFFFNMRLNFKFSNFDNCCSL